MNKALTISGCAIGLVLCAVFSLRAQWVATSYGVFAGRINTVFSNGTTALTSSFGAGVYVSYDNGSSWHLSNTGITTPYVVTFGAIGGNLFAGTADGVFISSDNAVTWSASGLAGNYITSITAVGSNLFAGAYGGPYRSSNNGLTWVPVTTGLPPTGISITSIISSGSNIFIGDSNGEVFLSSDQGDHWTQTVLAASYIYALAANPTAIFATSNTGLYSSSNQGTTWTKIENGFLTQVYSLAATGSNVFVGTNQGIFRTPDNGVTWVPVYSGSPGFVWSLAATGSNVLAAIQERGIILSVNDGNSWNEANTGLINSGAGSLAINGNNFFAGTNTGVVLSNDHGVTWSTVTTGLPHALIYDVVIKGSMVFAATESGIYRSGDQGANWSPCNNGVSTTFITSLAVIGNTLLAGTPNGLFISSDDGSAWNPGGLGNINIATILTTGNEIFVSTSTNKLFHSANLGVTWDSTSPGFFIKKLAAAGGKLYAGGYGGLYGSSDKGVSWNAIGGTAFNSGVSGLYGNGNNLFVFTPSQTEDVYLYTGNSLVLLNAGLPINKVVPAFAESGSTLFASVHLSYDATYGSIWSLSTLSFPTINSLSVNQGTVGSIVTIEGSNFSPVSSDNVVQFSNFNATVLQASATSLQVVVPSTYGKVKVKVTVNGQSVISLTDFSILPEITGFTPTRGYGGTYVVVRGTGFEPNSNTPVKFNGIAEAAYSTSNTYITTTVPLTAMTGPLSYVAYGHATTTTSNFTILPRITGFTPGSGVIGSSVTIGGSGFDLINNNNLVKFNGVSALVTSISLESIIVAVPNGAKSGAISVSVNGNVAMSEIPFIVSPITASCLYVPPKPTITVTGSSLEHPVLTSSNNVGNQWFLNGSPIPGATDASLSVSLSGIYTVQTSELDCQSPLSEGQAVMVTGLTDPLYGTGGGIMIFPNPATDVLAISLEGLQQYEPVDIDIYDGLGHRVERLQGEGGGQTTLQIQPYPSGVYLIRVCQAGKLYQEKFVKP